MKLFVALAGLGLVLPGVALSDAPTQDERAVVADPSAAAPLSPRKEGPVGIWMGEDVALRYSPTGDHRLGALAGVEAGWMPLAVPILRDYHFMLGPGLRAGWGPMWHFSAVLRLAVAGGERFSPRLYVQGGPLLMRCAAGADFQAGVDWLYGGGYLGAILEPQGDGRRSWTFVVGARIALVTLIASAVVVSSLVDLMGELFETGAQAIAR